MTGSDGPEAWQRDKDLSAVVEALIMLSPNPALFRELYYWGREPGLLPAMRAVVVVSEATRNAFELFVQNAPDALDIVAQHESDTCLRLEYRRVQPGDR